MEESSDGRAGSINCTPALPEVDMDILVGAGFNKARSAQHSQDVQLRKLTAGGEYIEQLSSEDYCSEGAGDFSPRHICPDQNDQAEKEIPISHLIERRFNSSYDVRVSNPLQTAELSTSTNPASRVNYHGPLFTKELLSAHPQYSSQPMILQTSVLPQREWQDTIPHCQEVTGPGTGFEDPSAADNGNLPCMLPANSTGTSNSTLNNDYASRGETIFNRARDDVVPMSPVKELTKIGRQMGDKSLTEGDAAIAGMSRESAANSRAARKGMSRRRTSATAHLSLEEKKKLRAARNRESAEKSRMRRKQMIHDLETNVARLREENRDLKAKVERYHGHLMSTSAEIRKRSEASVPDVTSGDETNLPVLYEALSALQRCVDECPRTFRKGAHSPPIPLNIRRSGPRGSRADVPL